MRFLPFIVIAIFVQHVSAQNMSDTDEPTALFANYCVSHFITPGFDVEDKLSGRNGVLKLTSQQSAPFLDNFQGNAWTFKTEKNQYVVAVTSNASCYLYAMSGDRDRAWRDFDALTSSMFQPWSVLELFPTLIGKDTDSHRNSKAIYYSAPQNAPTPAFFITTDYSDSPNSFAIRLKIQFAEKALLDFLKKSKEKGTGGK